MEGFIVKKNKIVLLGFVTLLLLCCCTKKEDVKEPEVSVVCGSYTIDVNSYAELAGDADYVTVGEVIEELGTEYEMSTPYTNYSVKVKENLKGELTKDEPIIIIKDGGITEDKKCIIQYESDELPVVGKTYVFYIYAQPDGSNLVSGPNSSILVSEDADTLTRAAQDKGDGGSVLEQIKEGVENQVETERARTDTTKSSDDVSVK